MKFFYSKSSNNFYVDTFVGADNIPADAQEISREYYDALILGLCQGKRLVPCDEHVAKLEDILPSAEEIAASVEAARRAAYAAEADPLFFKAQRGEATHDEWQAKIAEIKARYPEGQMPH